MAVFTAAEVAAQCAALLMALATAVTPTPEQRLSQWATCLEIPGETGSVRTGKLSFEGYEFLIEPLDGLHPDDPGRDETFVGSAQIAKTMVGQIATYYYSSVVPRPWAVGLPSGDEVLKYNNLKWQPIVDATPELRRKVRPMTSRDERGSTNTFKRFTGGTGVLLATGSPKALQMVTFCLVVMEETPNWEREVGDRGDPRSQLRKRQLQWEMAGAKTYHNSTPGIVTRSENGEDGQPGRLTGCPVTEDFEAGDQRRLYHPCPHCSDRPNGVWLRLDFEQMQGMGEGERPHFNCPGCGAEIDHRHKAEMVRRCRWLKTFKSSSEANPPPPWYIPVADLERWADRSSEGRARSRHAWQVVSPAVDWSYIAAEWRKAEKWNEAEKIAFSQQILGRAYEVTMAKADLDELLERRDARLVKGVVPSGAEVVVGAVDINGDWAQWTVYAFGPNSEHWVVDRGRIDGSPSETRLWTAMAELVVRDYPHADGGRCSVSWGIDSGFGTFHVYAFCNRYAHVKALDGAEGWGLMPLRRGAKQRLQGDDGTLVYCRTWRVGTWDLKRALLNEAIPAGLSGDMAARQAGKSHWPKWIDRDFFEELTGEALVEVQDRKTGVVKAETWVRVRRRNEEMDLWVYATAIARSMGIGVPGAEPDWIELGRRRQASTLGLEALWDRPPHASAARTPLPTADDASTPTEDAAAAAPMAQTVVPSAAPPAQTTGWFTSRRKR
jgi:phage terminase large subunit GpA-like protein